MSLRHDNSIPSLASPATEHWEKICARGAVAEDGLYDAERFAEGASSTNCHSTSFILRRSTTPTISDIQVPATGLHHVSIQFRELAKIAARANVQTSTQDIYDYESLGDAYHEVLAGFQSLQGALIGLGDPRLIELVHTNDINTSLPSFLSTYEQSVHTAAPIGSPSSPKSSSITPTQARCAVSTPSTARIQDLPASTQDFAAHSVTHLGSAVSHARPRAVYADAGTSIYVLHRWASCVCTCLRRLVRHSRRPAPPASDSCLWNSVFSY
ncbi:hypothetical protein C2E23DRAFT_884549 [Lenzites betulinus]|nr:hypothetical protein C2E23DRAFT_884549 [Lenzites betulinus]